MERKLNKFHEERKRYQVFCIFDRRSKKQESWIYRIKLSRKLTKLKLPEEINQAKITRVGYGEELYGEGHDSYENIFGDTIEPWHGCYGTLSNDDKNKRAINKLYFQIQ